MEVATTREGEAMANTTREIALGTHNKEPACTWFNHKRIIIHG